MSPLCLLLTFLVLGLASLSSGFPVLRKAFDSVYSRPVIIKEQNPAALNLAASGIIEKRQMALFSTPGHIDETSITLVNASPYVWNKVYIHEYQMRGWMEGHPDFIHPGESVTVDIRPAEKFANAADTAAEVEYNLVNTSRPMSFMVKFDNRRSSLKVEFRGALSSMNNAEGSVHKLEVSKFLGNGVGFIIAGKEGDFITNDPPIGWMQAMLPELKDKPLREIVLPRSHHSGLWKIHRNYGVSFGIMPQTQTVHLRDQLGNGGIRVLDFRPLRTGDDFREVHGSIIRVPGDEQMFVGGEGASLSEMIQTVNEFNRKHPGELIIWDVHGDDAFNSDEAFRRLKSNQEDRVALYNQFLTLEHRVDIPNDVEDVSKWPLSRFIGNKTSAVLINFDEEWRLKDLDWFPGNREGFVTGKLLPLTSKWSDSNNVKVMAKGQVESIHENRPKPQNALHKIEWILTMGPVEHLRKTILELAAPAWVWLFKSLWTETTSDSYPNWVSVDNVRGNEHKTLVMAMNHCLVAKKCGPLGGKVQF